MDFIIVVTAFAALAGLVLPLALMLAVGLWGKERTGSAGQSRGGRRPARGRGSGQPAPGGAPD